ncbi:UPF0481 protein At3g47200-like [Macadamia integrifolia]|uniref:UPF0481 protein At3g47200-like n=1 Tax=Macadamia integrifolia TaxID=60698 RepID=UPI001C4E77CF|nr:UPF0481 protein At3g47200-like [Macadamia integrifolia]
MTRSESSSINIEHLREKLLLTSNPSSLPTSCIFRVDKRIRKLNEDAYTPDTVSIGPYHRDAVRENLQMQDMEDVKWRYVKALLDRTSETPSLESYVKALKELQTDPRKCYSEPINSLNNKEENFLEMMLIDGLFIIELFRKCSHVVEVDDNDPIFNSKLRRTRIVRDLVLLENQIPMSVLEKLFGLSKCPKCDTFSLIELALNFFADLNGVKKYPQITNNTHKHLLDLLSCTLLDGAPTEQDSSTEALVSLPCATELRRSGINFKASRNYKLLEINFDKGEFEIPTLCVDDYTDCFFRNLIAYEQQSFEGRHHITSYALLMDHLINTADDVALLIRRGIIKNHLGDNGEVSSLFNNLCREISIDNKFCYNTRCKNLNDYYNWHCHKWIANFKRKYCSSPWAILSVLAAILLLFLTICSTVLSALPFFGVEEFIYMLDNGQQAIGSIVGGINATSSPRFARVLGHHF